MMNKENIIPPQYGEPAARITRGRAKALSTLGGILVQKCSVKPDQKCVTRTNLKRPASYEDKPNDIANAGSKNKRIAVLKEVTNVLCESSYMNCVNAAKVQPKKRPTRCLPKKRPKVGSFSSEIAQAQEDMALNSDQTSRTLTEEQELPVRLNENMSIQALFSPKPLRMPKKEEDVVCDKMENPGSGITNIDSRQKDPQMCSLYAPDIYSNLHVTELERRPSAYFMETVQRDITQSMRGILIDWLVEVSEEYSLVPDTLYLTVNFIDRFLSDNYIEKQRLQLLGVTCMLIASKYEEICAPQVEEFCFITDNTYSKEEVVKMESHVLNFLRFQLSTPTTKTFLRRFIQAAQARYEIPCAELEFLANYLAEITLVDYNFLKFLPSLVAASAVFLACWTLDQSDHPWSPTLEYYTNYKAAELKTSVLALQDLHFKTREGSLNSIRGKYKQQKFKCVANLTPPKHIESLFKD